MSLRGKLEERKSSGRSHHACRYETECGVVPEISENRQAEWCLLPFGRLPSGFLPASCALVSFAMRRSRGCQGNVCTSQASQSRPQPCCTTAPCVTHVSGRERSGARCHLVERLATPAARGAACMSTTQHVCAECCDSQHGRESGTSPSVSGDGPAVETVGASGACSNATRAHRMWARGPGAARRKASAIPSPLKPPLRKGPWLFQCAQSIGLGPNPCAPFSRWRVENERSCDEEIATHTGLESCVGRLRRSAENALA